MKKELKTDSYFCHATFFSLVAEAKKEVDKSGAIVSNPRILLELAKIFMDSDDIKFDGSPASQKTSKYRSGSGVVTYRRLLNPSA